MDNQNNFYTTKPLIFKYTFRIDRDNNEYYQIRRDLSRSLVEYSENYKRFRELSIPVHSVPPIPAKVYQSIR